MSNDLWSLQAHVVAAEVRAGRLTATAVAASVLERMEALGPRLNAYRVTTGERALREAAAVDATLAAGDDPGALAGVPFGAKDLFDVEGLPTAAGSKIGLQSPPAEADGVLVSRARTAGAVLVGVQTMDEYAYGFTTENAHFGPARNPHDLSRSAGGSSGGSAAAVAAGLGAFALGSDTNGSIRVPSSFCGVFGLKPTFGRLPRTGSFPFVFDLDHLGPFARSVEDLALVYDALQGHDGGDPACVARAPEPVLGRLAAPADGLRVGVLDGWFHDMAGPEAREAVATIAEGLGATVKVTLPGAQAGRSAAFLITAASGANLHRTNLRSRPYDFDPATRGRLLAGALLPADALLQAQRLRRILYDQAIAAFADFDLLLAPATPCPAPLLGQDRLVINGQDMKLRPNIGVLSQPLSAIGLPVVTVPVHAEGRMPIGVQLVAAPWREDIAFQAAARLQAAGLVSAPAVEPCG